MSKNISFVNDSNFKEEALDSEGLVMVDFYADWCMPCKMLTPIVEELADSNVGKVKILELDVDSSQVTASNYRVMSIPTIVFFKSGKEVERLVGLRGKEDFQSIIEKFL